MVFQPKIKRENKVIKSRINEMYYLKQLNKPITGLYVRKLEEDVKEGILKVFIGRDGDVVEYYGVISTLNSFKRYIISYFKRNGSKIYRECLI